MSKTLKKKKHWLSKVQECAVSWAGPPGDLGAEIRGGAERGEFPYLGRLRDEPGGGGGTCCVVSGKAPSPGDVLLEVNGTPVSGLTNRDTLAVIRHFREPIRLKTVKPVRVSIAVIKHNDKKQVGKQSLFQFHFYTTAHYQGSKGRKLEAITKAKNMGKCCSLACSL
ncbi:membrane-associated guanylate kinase, WW and PDZ domain-containing protein 1 isoform 4 [Cricetulus griseus]|nr:membrane-associated guanylate kinase, WW and PDZ domain-containing protein 1 isoform 4 [Cricetulus griseus]